MAPERPPPRRSWTCAPARERRRDRAGRRQPGRSPRPPAARRSPPARAARRPWAPRTAHAAAVQLLGAVDRMERSQRALATLCAALDRDVFGYFELLFGDPQRYPCSSGLGFFVFGDENVPRPTSSVHRGAALAIHRGRAVLRTTLTHRYHPSSNSDPTRLTVRARMLLVRDGAGIWRLATVEPLLPLVAVSAPQGLHRRRARAPVSPRRRRGRKAVADAARRDAAREAATVDAAAPAPCAATLAGDRAGDVVVQESEFRARDQAATPASTSSASDWPGAAWRCARRAAAGALRRCRCSTRATARSRSASPTAARRAGHHRRRRRARPLRGRGRTPGRRRPRRRPAGRAVGHGHGDARRRALARSATATTRGSGAARARRAPSRRCARRTCSAAPPPRRARRARGP